VEVVDRDPNAQAFFPSPYLELVFSETLPEIPEGFPWHKRGGHYGHMDGDRPVDMLLAGTSLSLLGARSGRWLVGRPRAPSARHWRAIDGFVVDSELVSVETEASA